MASTARTSNAIIGRMLDAMANSEQEPLSEMIESYLVKRPRARRRVRSHRISMVDRPRPGGRLSPSSIGGCKREAVLKFTGVPGRRRLDTHLELIFEDGNWRHHKWQALFLDMERVLGRKTFRVVSFEARAVYEDLYIAGNLDVHVVIRGVHIIIDIKGINSFGFKRVVVQDQRPMEHHVWQLLGYMKAKKVRRGIVLYDCKDNQEYKPFMFHFDKEQWAEVTAWCDSVISSMENKRMPARHPDCHAGQFKYNRCVYKWVCFGKLDPDGIWSLAYNSFVSVEQAWAEGFAAFEQALEASS